MSSSLFIPVLKHHELLNQEAREEGYELVPYEIPEGFLTEIRTFMKRVFIENMGFEEQAYKIFFAENGIYVGVLLDSLLAISNVQSRLRGFFNEKDIDTKKLSLPSRSQLEQSEPLTQKLTRKRRASGQNPSASEESGIWKIPQDL